MRAETWGIMQLPRQQYRLEEFDPYLCTEARLHDGTEV